MDLEQLALKIEEEVRRLNIVGKGGKGEVRGKCGQAVELLLKEIPGAARVSLLVQLPNGEGSKHIVAEINGQIVDPTISQYANASKRVFSEGEYPLRILAREYL